MERVSLNKFKWLLLTVCCIAYAYLTVYRTRQSQRVYSVNYDGVKAELRLYPGIEKVVLFLEARLKRKKEKKLKSI